MLKSKYNHILVEKEKYSKWKSNNLFLALEKSSKPNFTMILPPPNITGKLHLGHAWDGTIQDIIIRYKKMMGFNCLWVPGKDHAGISMQRKVEAKIKRDGVNTNTTKEEAFFKAAWEWKEEHNNILNEQWGKLGLSLDYSKEKFTMDDDVSYAVKFAFVEMYNKGLIYQGNKVVNWDPNQKTAISNMEVIHKKIKSKMYYIKYPFINNEGFISVATTRPETMFADVCIIVNPQDDKLNKFIGREVINPSNNKIMKIIGDNYVSREEGTGAMKCTPAHDFNDFELGLKHNLEMPVCMNEDGTMNEHAIGFVGLDRFECRKKLIEKLKNDSYLIKIENHDLSLGYSERSNAIVEPMLSKQWFVKMKEISKSVIKNFKNDSVSFLPSRFNETYYQWMEKVEDWCISRQLLWGHKIPVWKNKKTKKIYVGVDEPENKNMWIQEKMVLDTWFSSSLWPFSTLGWPNKTELYKNFFPTSVLVTGYDIIFFWVLRMIFQSQILIQKNPFQKVIIHGLIRDSNGVKMSKSLGNGIDPIDVIDEYGADSLRHFLATNSSPGLDLRYDKVKIASSWNFINKIWNIARYVQMVVADHRDFTLFEELSTLDHWIVNRLNLRLKKIKSAMEVYEFGIANKEIYSFVYDEFASVYIELLKVDLEKGVKGAKNTLLYVLLSILKILHPYIPFVTEHIYQTFFPNQFLVNEKYPHIIKIDQHSDQITSLNGSILRIRQFRSENNIKKNIEIVLEIKFDQELNIDYAPYLKKLVNVAVIKKGNNTWDKIPFAYGTILIDLNEYIDKNKQLTTWKKQLAKIESEIAKINIIFENKDFVQNAPQKVIQKNKDAILKLKENKAKLLGEIKKNNK